MASEARDLLRRPGSVGAGDGGHIVHDVGVIVFGDEAEADLRDAVAAGEAAAQGLTLKGFHGDHADIVGPRLERFAHAGDGPRTAHADHDAVHEAGTLPRNGSGDGGAGDAAVVFGVIVVGQPVHVVPAVFGGLGLSQRPRSGQPVPGRRVEDLGPKAEQILLPQGGGVLRHGEHDGMPGGAAGQRQRDGKGARRGFNDGLAGGKGVLFRRKGPASLRPAHRGMCRWGR